MNLLCRIMRLDLQYVFNQHKGHNHFYLDILIEQRLKKLSNFDT